MNLENFQRHVTRLKNLLDDPQLGLFTWHGFLNETMEEISKEYYGLNHDQIRKAVHANQADMGRSDFRHNR